MKVEKRKPTKDEIAIATIAFNPETRRVITLKKTAILCEGCDGEEVKVSKLPHISKNDFFKMFGFKDEAEFIESSASNFALMGNVGDFRVFRGNNNFTGVGLCVQDELHLQHLIEYQILDIQKGYLVNNSSYWFTYVMCNMPLKKWTLDEIKEKIKL
jgi:hypothetical protein